MYSSLTCARLNIPGSTGKGMNARHLECALQGSFVPQALKNGVAQGVEMRIECGVEICKASQDPSSSWRLDIVASAVYG